MISYLLVMFLILLISTFLATTLIFIYESPEDCEPAFLFSLCLMMVGVAGILITMPQFLLLLTITPFVCCVVFEESMNKLRKKIQTLIKKVKVLIKGLTDDSEDTPN